MAPFTKYVSNFNMVTLQSTKIFGPARLYKRTSNWKYALDHLDFQNLDRISYATFCKKVSCCGLRCYAKSLTMDFSLYFHLSNQLTTALKMQKNQLKGKNVKK